MVSTTTMKMYFPLHYFDLIKPVEDQIDPLLVLSLIRQESAFNKQARSIVGARGLMQVMPTTARMIASVRPTALFDPKTNIKVGTKYLLKRLTQYDGDVELTLAAYNAGFGRVDQWLRRYPTANKVLFLDFIPFKETREYVATILRNYYWYVKLYEAKPQDTDNTKLSTATPKVISIISANAGLAATPARR
jgi:soluble lytic murein transglycosylase